MNGYKHKIEFLLSSEDTNEIAFDVNSEKKEQHLDLSPPPSQSPPSSPLPSQRESILDNSPPSSPPITEIYISRTKNNELIMRRAHRRATTTPYLREEDFVNWWVKALRAQTYCTVLSSAKQESSSGTQKRFRCTFSSNCDKIIKGKGNLRRHVEWHLRKAEEEARSNYAKMIPQQRELLQQQFESMKFEPQLLLPPSQLVTL